MDFASASEGIIFDKIQGRVCFNYYRKGGTEGAIITPYWSRRNLLSWTPQGKWPFLMMPLHVLILTFSHCPFFLLPSSDQYQLQPFSSSLNIHILCRIWQSCSKALCSLCGNFPQQYNTACFISASWTCVEYQLRFHYGNHLCLMIKLLLAADTNHYSTRINFLVLVSIGFLPYFIHWGALTLSLCNN